jgi:hypothetical protein
MLLGLEEAWIAAGSGGLGIISTAVVAIVAASNTRQANQRTIDAGTADTVRVLDAARADKLWDQRRSAYHELTAYLLYVQAKRRLDMRNYRLADDGEEALQRLLGNYKPPNWWELQARIAHYGSDDVIGQFEASHDADDRVAMLTFRLADLNQQAADASASGNRAAAPDIRDIQAAREDLQGGRLTAEQIDQSLIKLMRAELNRKPSQDTAPPELGQPTGPALAASFPGD